MESLTRETEKCPYCYKRHRKDSRIGMKHSSPLCQKCPYKECFTEAFIPNVGWAYGGHSPGEHGFCLTYERFVEHEISLEEALRIKEYTNRRHEQGLPSKSHDYDEE